MAYACGVFCDEEKRKADIIHSFENGVDLWTGTTPFGFGHTLLVPDFKDHPHVERIAQLEDAHQKAFLETLDTMARKLVRGYNTDVLVVEQPGYGTVGQHAHSHFLPDLFSEERTLWRIIKEDMENTFADHREVISLLNSFTKYKV